jgi:CO dehydrogenase/acetyl-CoA synthase beta subunit
MMKNNVVKKAVKERFCNYIDVNLNGGWERWVCSMQEYKDQIKDLTPEQIKLERQKILNLIKEY